MSRPRNWEPLLEDAAALRPALVEAGFTDEQAHTALKAIIGAGYFIAPREPTNSMLLSYLRSYGAVATNPATTIRSLAKARKRWEAMGEDGTRVAMAVRRRSPGPTLVERLARQR